MPSIRIMRAVTVVPPLCLITALVLAPTRAGRSDVEGRNARRRALLSLSTKAPNNSLRYLHTTWWTDQGYLEQATDLASASSPGESISATDALMTPPAYNMGQSKYIPCSRNGSVCPLVTRHTLCTS